MTCKSDKFYLIPHKNVFVFLRSSFTNWRKVGFLQANELKMIPNRHFHLSHFFSKSPFWYANYGFLLILQWAL